MTQPPCADLYELLQCVKECPGMYVRALSLEDLESQLWGYETALATHGIEEFGTGFRRRFCDYLYQRFGWGLALGWATAIRRHSRAKDRGWKRFFQLVDEFAETVGADKPAGLRG